MRLTEKYIQHDQSSVARRRQINSKRQQINKRQDSKAIHDKHNKQSASHVGLVEAFFLEDLEHNDDSSNTDEVEAKVHEVRDQPVEPEAQT